MSLEVDVFCTNDLPPFEAFVASLEPTRRHLVSGTSWDDFHVGHVTVSVLPGATSHPRWQHPHAWRLALSGSAGGRWQDVIFVLSDLVDVTGGAVRTYDEMFDHTRRISPPNVVEARLAAIRAANDFASLDAAFEALDSLDDGPLFRRCCELALAEAARGRNELWEPIVRLAKKDVQYLADVKHDGKDLAQWLAQRQTEGVKLKAAVRKWLAR